MTTKVALLKAAHDLFIERGYEGVSTRDITQAAKANLASIPYYFGSKSELFVETVKYALSTDSEMHFAPLEGPPTGYSDKDSTALFKELIGGFIAHLLDDDDKPSICCVMFREITNRNPETADMRKQLVEFFHDRFMQPLSKTIMDLVQKINVNLEQADAQRIAKSIMAQCIYLASNEAFVEHERGHSIRNPEFIKEASDHICRFSLAGITNF